MYDVYLNDLCFYSLSSTSLKHDRKIVIYNGVGSGYFPKADDPQLKSWSWDCELQDFPERYHGGDFVPARTIMAGLEALEKSKEPARLVIYSGTGDGVSEQVFVESYTYKEIYAGVYKVSVSVTEYKEAKIRSTTIPEIPRPGKIPALPPITPSGGKGEGGKDDTPYDQAPVAPDSWTNGENLEHTHGAGPHDPWEDMEGNPVNPVSPGGGNIKYDPNKTPWESMREYDKEHLNKWVDKGREWVNKGWEWIGKGYESFKDKFKATQESIDRVHGRG